MQLLFLLYFKHILLSSKYDNGSNTIYQLTRFSPYSAILYYNKKQLDVEKIRNTYDTCSILILPPRTHTQCGILLYTVNSINTMVHTLYNIIYLFIGSYNIILNI